MKRWKIINNEKAKQLGIEMAKPDDEGIIRINLDDIPRGMGIEQFVTIIEETGIILEGRRQDETY